MSEKRPIALITGGGRGIGKACAQLFFGHGFDVVVTSRSQDQLDAVVRECQGMQRDGQRVLGVRSDISQLKDIEVLFDTVEKELGKITVLINNAGYIKVADILSTTEQDWQQTINVNLKGSYFCAQHAFRHMKDLSHACSIVNISSLGGLTGTEKFQGFSSYSISKFGVIGLTETLAVEGKPYGIRVNCVAPGAVDTQMLQEAAPFLKTSTTPMDVAKVIWGLCSEDISASVTGAIIPIYSNEN